MPVVVCGSVIMTAFVAVAVAAAASDRVWAVVVTAHGNVGFSLYGINVSLSLSLRACFV